MKLERLQEYMTVTVTTVAGVLLAVFCGVMAGRGQLGNLLMIIGLMVTLVLCLSLKQRIWMLIPIFWTLTGQVRELPIPFAVKDIVVMGTFCVSLLFIALKIIRGKPRYEFLDLLMGAILVYLGITFLRNPVGVEALNSERVGGKPYFNVFVAILAYLVLTRVSLNPKEARVFPIFVGLGAVINGILGAISFHFPAAVPWMSRFYSGINVETFMERGEIPGTQRHTYLATAMVPLTILISYFDPRKLISPFRVWLFIPTMLCFAAILFSGFRSMLLGTVIYFCVASYVRSGLGPLFRLALVGLPMLVLLVLGQGRLYNLPFPAQRALSFLPGKWEYEAVQSGKQSTEWRTYMWKIVLTEDKYIQNKVLGDGFGFSKREYEVIKRIGIEGDVSGDQESVMIMGGVHSGPISTIRTIGIVGLVPYALFLILFARYAWRLVIRAQGTAFFPLALFLGLPVLLEPLSYFFIYGAFDGSLPESLFRLGMLNMLRNSLERAELMAASVALPEKTLPLHRRQLSEGGQIARSTPVPARGVKRAR